MVTSKQADDVDDDDKLDELLLDSDDELLLDKLDELELDTDDEELDAED